MCPGRIKEHFHTHRKLNRCCFMLISGNWEGLMTFVGFQTFSNGLFVHKALSSVQAVNLWLQLELLHSQLFSDIFIFYFFKLLNKLRAEGFCRWNQHFESGPPPPASLLPPPVARLFQGLVWSGPTSGPSPGSDALLDFSLQTFRLFGPKIL